MTTFNARAFLVSGLAVLITGLFLLFGSVLWPLIAEATNHGYPFGGIFAITGLIGVFSIIASIPLMMTWMDLERGRNY